ncbi:hypothetical protein L7F22_055060 [Adiantum nelumboides]|nr:hypothetical protein [Adiantum nelumboides]
MALDLLAGPRGPIQTLVQYVRCPFFSCKGCCVKAANACQIHVLKPPGESLQGSHALLPAHGPMTSSIVRHPYDSLRLRTARPMGLITKKEAGITNSWRFGKLRAHLEGLTVCEDEAFDRYMQNSLLLEELFDASFSDSLTGQGPLLMAGCASYERLDGKIDAATVSASLRVRQRVSLKKHEARKQRLKRVIDRGLQKLLYKGEETDDFTENEEIYLSGLAARRELKRMKIQNAEGKERLRRIELFTLLVDKLKVVENQEDFDICLGTYEDNFVNYKTSCSRLERTFQTAATEKHASLGDEHGERTESSSASDLILTALFEARVNSFGVMKETWRVDTCENEFGGSIWSVETL